MAADYSFLEENRIVPVVVFNDVSETMPKLTALASGGIHAAEITFRTACAAEAIRLAVERFPHMAIGAGTVVNAEQCRQAIAAGAQFIVSPGMAEDAAAVCAQENVPYLPGCVTPTEIVRARAMGFDIIKFFPAGVYGGLKAIQALAPVFPGLRFVPTGGVDLKNLAEFLACPAVAAVGGSFMMKGTPAEIEKSSRAAAQIAEGCR